ncbi:MAG TPA: oligopeptidase A, partial [Agitococcus sp.]|nr:oligopeptidase A [Agitococcus sp.]
MTNPLLTQQQLPAFSQITPELVVPTIEQLLTHNREKIAAIADQQQPTWQSLPAQLEELDDTLSKAWSLVSHLNAVTNSPAWRDAYNQCLAKISAYYTEIGQNSKLYQSYQQLADSADFEQLSTAQQQTIKNALRDFKLSGVALADDKKQRFAEIEERLSALSAKFADNLLDATQAWHKPLTDIELQGLPEAHQGLLAQLAQQR